LNALLLFKEVEYFIPLGLNIIAGLFPCGVFGTDKLRGEEIALLNMSQTQTVQYEREEISKCA